MNKMIIRKYILLLAIPLIVVAQEVDYKKISPHNSFVLIIDRSGSMRGNAIEDAKQGAIKFISHLKKGDKAGLITFSNDISLDVPITSNLNSVKRGINNIIVGGATKLNDALAVGVKQLIHDSNKRIMVYLTDGKDNGSNFGIEHLESMFQGENVFIYGIGVGEVDVNSLKNIGEMTGGKFHTISANNTNRLSSIYTEVLNSFYTDHADNSSKSGSLIVKTLPRGYKVHINGKNAGVTPLKVSNLQPGLTTVEVFFSKDRIWKKEIEIKEQYTASIRAHELDALKNLMLISKPHGATVFIDGEYVGYTSNEIVDVKKRRWYKKAWNNPNELKIIGLKKGIHKIEVIGFPDFDYGPDQKVLIDYLLKNDDVIFIDIFKNTIKNKDGKIITAKERKDIFEF